MRYIARARFQNKNDEAADANQTAQTNFYNTLTDNYNTDFGDFEGAVEGLQKTLQPVISAGPGQYGYDATENNALMTNAENTDAAAAKNSQQALQEQIAQQSGGTSLVPTGAEEELEQQGDVSAAQKTASDENAITTAGYTQGNQNYENALTGEENVTSMMNPNAFASSVTSGGTAATGAVNADTNAQEASDSWMTLAGGALSGAASYFGTTAAKPKAQ